MRVTAASPGFSLLEVLVATTIMIVIVVMVVNMFRNSSEAWDTGVQSAEMNTSARAAIGYISRELSCAVAGSIPTSIVGMATLKPFQLINGTGLNFVALSGENQALYGIKFGYDNYAIQTMRLTNNFKPYENSAYDSWDPNPPLLITNVWRFEVNAYSNESDMMAGRFSAKYDSSEPANTNSLPVCVDISLEMLSERDMARILTPGWTVPQQEGFAMTNSRVYTTRVCFPNRGAR